MSHTKIFVLQHKSSDLPTCFNDRTIYQPLQCGRSLGVAIPGTLGDDSGDNISALNQRYNEMTGIYWVARHYQELGDPEYVGFDHYRRFLNWKPEWLRPGTVIARKWFSWRTLGAHFALCHPKTELDRFGTRFAEVMGSAYADYHLYWNTHGFYICNMFIMHREDFMRYAEFIIQCINILRDLERERPFAADTISLQRTPGYILERMTGYWIWHEKRIRHIKVISSTITHHNELNLPSPVGTGFLWFLRKAY